MTCRAPFWALTPIVGIFLTGCVTLTPPAPASATRGLTLETKSSRSIYVAGPRFQMNRGSMELAGSIAKNAGAGTTAFSHLDVLFRDNSGRVLLTMPIRFSPRSVGHSRFASNWAYYALSLDNMPAGTTRIEVQGHDADIKVSHEIPHS